MEIVAIYGMIEVNKTMRRMRYQDIKKILNSAKLTHYNRNKRHRGIYKDSPPKASPMHCKPMHTPNKGTVGPSSKTVCKDIPES